MQTATPAAPQGFGYFPEFLSQEEQHLLLQRLEALNYAHDVFRGQPLKRSGRGFGYDYLATGRRLQPAPPFPDFLVTLIENAVRRCPEAADANQCLVQCYPVGAGIGWHTDAPRFGEIILGVSLRADARLQFRPNRSEPVGYELLVAPGSLYVLRGTARWGYQHRVLPVKSRRYSLTFRTV